MQFCSLLAFFVENKFAKLLLCTYNNVIVIMDGAFWLDCEAILILGFRMSVCLFIFIVFFVFVFDFDFLLALNTFSRKMAVCLKQANQPKFLQHSSSSQKCDSKHNGCVLYCCILHRNLNLLDSYCLQKWWFLLPFPYLDFEKKIFLFII